MNHRWLIKTLLAAVGAAALFVYGVLVGRYEIFPFSLIQTVQNSFGEKPAAADTGEGAKLYETLCARCHGNDGSGGEGPSLNRPNLSRASDDEALRAIIEGGIGAMPAVRQTNQIEQRQLVAYVRSLGRAAPSEPENGNAQRGMEIYNAMECASCHVINGAGVSFGPDLTEIGALRGPSYLKEALLKPSSALPRGLLEGSSGLMEFLPLRVITRNGEEVRGFRVNEDTFTIQLRDMANQLRSFRKADLRHFETEPDKSLMPSVDGRLNESETNDLVAYLSSLKGRN